MSIGKLNALSVSSNDADTPLVNVILISCFIDIELEVFMLAVTKAICEPLALCVSCQFAHYLVSVGLCVLSDRHPCTSSQ